MSLKTQLHDEIQSELSDISKLEVGSDQHRTAVDSVTRLWDRMNESEKLEIEKMERAENREIDLDLKLRQMEEERKKRIIQNFIDVGSIVTTLGLTVWGTLKTLKFEETGTVTTTAGRNFINKLFRKN